MNWNILWRKHDHLTPVEAASKRRVYVFLICLFCSTLFWLFIKLSQESRWEFEASVKLVNLPDDLFLTAQSDSVISFTLQATGIYLLRERLSQQRETIPIDFSVVGSGLAREEHVRFISGQQLRSAVNLQTEDRVNVVGIRPDTLFFQFEPASSRLVPVNVQSSISFRQRFGRYGSIMAEPDSVWVSGPSRLVDSLHFVNTVLWEENDVRESKQVLLRLALPQTGDPLKFDPGEVTVSLPVTEFTESVIEIPLEFSCPEGLDPSTLRLFPSRVQISYLVSFQDYASVSPDMFKATVDCSLAFETSGANLPVTLMAHPSFVEILSVRPASVDFVIIQ